MTPLLQTTFHQKPPFIPVNQHGFHIDNQHHNPVDITIHDFLFVRKHFSHGKMVCYSLDAVTAANGKCCNLCAWNYACTNIVRLMVMIHSIQPNLQAIIDVADASFDSIGHVLETVNPKDLHKTIITATVKPESKPLKIQFDVRF